MPRVALDAARPVRLDPSLLMRGVRSLTRTDPHLATVVDRHGPPPLWARRPGFSTLIRIVLEQQVSLASGRAMYRTLERRLGGVSARAVRHAGVDVLRSWGVTRQKASYCVGIAEDVLARRLLLQRVGLSGDDRAREQLLAVRGIGPWTADVYLLMALGRPDIWPPGDVALLTALQHLRGSRERPSSAAAIRDVERWRPWRAVGARLLWHGYLQGSLRAGASRV